MCSEIPEWLEEPKVNKFLILMLMISSAVFAQEKKLQYRLSGGLSVITSPNSVKDSYHNAFNISVGIGYKLVPKLMTGASLTYNSFGFDKEQFLRTAGGGFISPNTVVDGGTITVWEVAGFASYDLLEKDKLINFYLIGTTGLAVNLRTDLVVLIGGNVTASTDGRTDVNFLAGGGVGTKIRITPKIRLFVEGRSNIILGQGDDLIYLPIQAGFIVH